MKYMFKVEEGEIDLKRKEFTAKKTKLFDNRTTAKRIFDAINVNDILGKKAAKLSIVRLDNDDETEYSQLSLKYSDLSFYALIEDNEGNIVARSEWFNLLQNLKEWLNEVEYLDHRNYKVRIFYEALDEENNFPIEYEE